MSYMPIEQLEQLRVGTVDFVSPNEVKVVLEIDSPDAVSLNSGSPRSFPRINSYVLVSSDDGYLVGQVEWIGVERSPYPKRKGLQDFGLIDLPFPLKRLSLNPVGALKRNSGGVGFRFSRGADAFPSVGDSVLIPTDQQLNAILESGENRRVQIGESPLSNNVKIAVDPDRLFGRHIAVLGNTGSGKSCSVAGLIQWSLDSVTALGRKPNARFIILDPNGEYSRAFSPESKYQSRVFRVGAEESENQLKVPAWFWNSAEWAAFTNASPKAQLPLLRHSLRAMRNEQFDIDDSVDVEARNYLRILLTSINLSKGVGKIFTDVGPSKGFVELLIVSEENLQDIKSRMTTNELDVTITAIQEYLETRRRERWPKVATISEVRCCLGAIKGSFEALGGDESDLLPKNEDTPVPFDSSILLLYLESLAKNTGSEQYIEYLLARIRTMLGDSRISSITKDTDERIDLAEWLASYLGDNESDECVSIIDLSLVPNEITHLITAVISRKIFEALQRYRKQNGQPLPTVLVAEEAHTFIKRYKDDSEIQDTASVCCKVFEKIAREGRKFGLGLVVSSQRPSELSPTVLSQCNTFLLHRISNDRDQEQVHRLVPDNMRGLLRELPSLPSRHAILLGWASELPVLVRMKELAENNRPHSDDPDYWEVWSGKSNTNGEEVDVPREVDWRPIVEEWQRGSEDIC